MADPITDGPALAQVFPATEEAMHPGDPGVSRASGAPGGSSR